MNRLGWNLLILGGIGVIALALFAGATAVADDDSEVRVERKGKVRIVVVDDDGDQHEEVYEFDGDHPRAFLGVSLDRAPDGGVRVEHVVDDSAAQRAGLEEGDVIVGFDGDEIDTPSGLTRRVMRSEPGDRVDLEVIRDGERLTLTAELGERPWRDFSMGFDFGVFGEQMERLGEQMEHLEFDLDWDADSFQENMEQLQERLSGLDLDFDFDHPHFGHHRTFFMHSRPKLGVELVEATPELREHLGSTRDEGVLVSRLIAGLPAEESGVLVGDLIVAVDGDPIEDSGDLRRALRDKSGETIDLEVIREKSRMNLRVFIPEAEELNREEDARRDPHREVHPAVGPSHNT